MTGLAAVTGIISTKIFEKIHLKIKSLNILNSPKNQIGDPLRKHGRKDNLLFILQQNISIELHMISMLKQFSLQLGEADAAV